MPASGNTPAPEYRSYNAPPVAPSRVVQKPTTASQASSPRDFQLQQLRRRFSPTETISNEAVTLSFALRPSDPDFPFDLDALQCVLRVPVEYPALNAPPTLRVTNTEMGRGIQANVEAGFVELVPSQPEKRSLLGLLNALDRRLESLLTAKAAPTVKLVANAGPSINAAPPSSPAQRPDTVNLPVRLATSALAAPAQVYSTEQRSAASERRTAETRQLASRLGRLPGYQESSDGVAFTVPVTPARRGELPVPLQAISTVQLFVPLLYPLLPCRVRLQGVSRQAAQPVERAFERRAVEFAQMSLMGHINYLTSGMHALTQQGLEMESDAGESHADDESHTEEIEYEEAELKDDRIEGKSHVHYIPRPPEWDVGHDGNPDLEEATDSEAEDTPASDDAAEESTSAPHAGESTTERGISISFPGLELHGIELLELAALSISVKCERCKTVADVQNLRSLGSGTPRQEPCRKCASTMSIGTPLIPVLSKGFPGSSSMC